MGVADAVGSAGRSRSRRPRSAQRRGGGSEAVANARRRGGGSERRGGSEGRGPAEAVAARRWQRDAGCSEAVAARGGGCDTVAASGNMCP